jgi:biotin carboxylase
MEDFVIASKTVAGNSEAPRGFTSSTGGSHSQNGPDAYRKRRRSFPHGTYQRGGRTDSTILHRS